MFDPTQIPQPDDCGFFFHPDIPDGEGWLMVAKYETEGSGPCALFVRRAA